MAENPGPQHSQPKVVQELVEAAKKAFDPSHDEASREAGLTAYNELVER